MYWFVTVRSSTGCEVWKATSGPQSAYAVDERFKREETKLCRAIAFSPDNRLFAWGNGTEVKLSTVDGKIVANLPRPKAFYLKFSPKGKYLMTWEIFTTSPANPDGSPNFYIYEAGTGTEVYSVIQKRQIDWEAHFSSDESLMAIMIGGEVLFFELNGPDSDGFSKPAKKLGGGRNGSVSMSPGPNPHIGFYVPGTKGAPSMCKLYKYPSVDAAQPVASKSFFQADRVEMLWNSKGTGMLLLTSTDVDQTGVSYYGKQALHFINTKGDSFAVQLNTDGPIHSVAWSPKATEFCVVYGFMPAKATLFNLKCDPIFEFGTGPRNAIYYNAFGNLLLFGGFGNLRGNVEVWDMNKRVQISSGQAPDTTLLEWSPTGDIYFTATCAPRLRIGNGFKIYHYSGALLHETFWPEKQELWELIWQNFPPGTFAEPIITEEKIEGIKSSQPMASTQKYVPPCVRDNLVKPDEKYIPGLPPGYKSDKKPPGAGKRTNTNQRRNNNSRQQLDGSAAGGGEKKTPQQQKGGDRKGQQKSVEANNATNGGGGGSDGNTQTPRIKRERPNRAPPQSQQQDGSTTANDQNGSDPTPAQPTKEKDPKIPKIHKKLREIRVLKEKQEKGEKLDGNQVAKLQTEQALVKELSALKLAEKQKTKTTPK